MPLEYNLPLPASPSKGEERETVNSFESILEKRINSMIQWIFFDVGGVLLNDDPVMAAVFRHIWQSVRAKGHDLSFEELMQLREDISARGPRLRIHHEVALEFLTMLEWKQTRRRYLDETLPELERLCPPMPGMKTLIRKLKSKVRLGLIANQPDDVIPVLEQHGFWSPFEVKGISEVVELSKPDPDFYRWALQTAGCKGREAIMVGDTVKYDMRPARHAGMRTVWFSPSVRQKRHSPQDEFERLYLQSLQRQQASRRDRVRREVKPDAMAHTAKELLEAIEKVLKEG